MMAVDEGAIGEELERRDDLGADDRMLAHERPLVGIEGAALAQHGLRHADLADVVQEPGLRERVDLVGRQSERGAEPASRGADALGVTARAHVFRLQRVRQAEQRLTDRAAQLVVEAPHVLGVPQALEIRG